MKIAIWHNLPSGGGKRALYYHVTGLIERGHYVEAWCPPTADQSYLPLSELITENVVSLNWLPWKAGGGNLLEIFAHYHNENVFKKYAALNNHCIHVAEEINRGKFDILFANACKYFRVSPIGKYVNASKALYLQEPSRWLFEAMPTPPWAALPSPRILGWTPHYIAAWLKDKVKVPWYRFQIREEFLNAKAFDAILVNSFFSRESVLRSYGLDAKVCYLGIDTNLFSCQYKDSKEDFIVGLGAVIPEKNISLIIRAIAKIPLPRPRLVWVGNVAYPPYLNELLKLSTSENVDFEPKISIGDAEVVDLLNKSFVMVYAPRLEPFGFAPLEANACGTPVIAVAEGGVRETIQNRVNGLLVEHDPQAIADAIQLLRLDKDFAHKLGMNGRKLVLENWSLPSTIDRLEDRFREVINQSGKID